MYYILEVTCPTLSTPHHHHQGRLCSFIYIHNVYFVYLPLYDGFRLVTLGSLLFTSENTERTEFGKARCILDWVTNKGEKASYELLKILDVTKKRTLDPGLHPWISYFPFKEDDAEATLLF
uniref:Uncharacterized protein n=1 Tax=Sinocyclocheilus rhinocerous TaxID=307959 RepID=A0A673NLF7_9TELE